MKSCLYRIISMIRSCGNTARPSLRTNVFWRSVLRRFIKKIPRIHEIDEEVATLSAKKARALLSGESSGLEDLKAAISLLSQERNALLVCNSYPEDYLELPYKCPVCQDTGYVGSQKCTCFKKAEIELLYTQSNLKEILKKENFDHFSFDFYSDTITNDSTGLTERETARRAYKMAKEFVADFDNSFQNLFFYGDTGVGKTFLSHCIAHDLLDSAHLLCFIFLHSSFLIFLQALLFPEAMTLPMMNRF